MSSRPSFFSRLFHRRAARTPDDGDAPRAPHRSGGIGRFFRRLFRRPTSSSVQPISENIFPWPTPRESSSDDDYDDTPSDRMAPPRNNVERSAPRNPNAAEQTGSWLSGLMETRLNNEASSVSSALARFREELLEAFVMAMLDQQEIEQAEQDLAILHKQNDLSTSEESVREYEKQYYDAVESSSILSVSMGEHIALEGRLVLSRLLLSVERISTDLLIARRQHGEHSSQVADLAAMLDRHIDLLTQSTEDSSNSINCLIELERLKAIKTTHPDSSPRRPLVPYELHEVYEALISFTPQMTISTGPPLSFRITSQSLRIEFLKQRQPGRTEISVRRQEILTDSSEVVMCLSPNEMKKRIFVKYQGEDGNDFGGMSREWMYSLSARLIAEGLAQGYLKGSSQDAGIVYIAPSLYPSALVLARFEFLGRLLAIALFHGRVLDLPFGEAFYKALLDSGPMVLADVASVDSQYHRSLTQILETPNADELSLTFSVDYQENSITKSHDLIPAGTSVTVTDRNKSRYVSALVEWMLVKSVAKQTLALRKGFFSVVSHSSVESLDPSNLLLLVCGVPYVDLDDWRANTTYENGYTASSQVVLWFWQAVCAFSPQKQCEVLKFATGASRPPAQGFAGLSGANGAGSFCLYRNNEVTALPVGHTCINRLDLPAYTSYDMLVAKLTTAVEETEGFNIIQN